MSEKPEIIKNTALTAYINSLKYVFVKRIFILRIQMLLLNVLWPLSNKISTPSDNSCERNEQFFMRSFFQASEIPLIYDVQKVTTYSL